MGNLDPLGLTRRSFVAVSSALFVVAALPQKIWAAALRPETAFQTTTLEATFEALGGVPKVSDGIVFSTPDIAENGAVVPVRIEIDTSVLSDVSKIYVIVEKNPNPLAAVFQVPPNTQPYAETRVKVAQTGNLYAVAEANGELYMMQRETKVTLGGCGG
jgi:sulfur-oxidizing protein SoxY